ncbi:MAG: DUF481 domain-containing protein [Candidatus Neomarinimicrobiota bacterium]
MLAIGPVLSAQINTEAMRKGELTPGLHPALDIDVGVVAGNSRLLRMNGTLRFDYLKGADHTFLVIGRQLGETDSLFMNKGFVHLRRTQSLHGGILVEGFMQKEFNQFLRLKDRNLAGGGLRIRWLGGAADEKGKPLIRLLTGLGFMWEQELIRNAKAPEDTLKNLLRSTNYLVLGWEPDERLLLQVSTYFQPDITRLFDFRVLLDGGLTFALTGKLSVAIKMNARYDNDPPTVVENGVEKSLKKYDVELTTGLAYVL